MSKHFERNLLKTHEMVLSLFGVVEQMIDDAFRALCERKIDVAEQVIGTDDTVDYQEVVIEEECLKMLALHQPVASNLRRVTIMLKINAELERIADLACNIAERAQALYRYEFFPIPDDLAHMVSDATDMVRMSLDAFVNSDTALAKEVIRRDQKVDEANRIVINELKEMMKSDSDLVDPALHCFSASRHVERIADLAENIAEDVIYLVDGDIVRHQHGKLATKIKD